ncbi:rhomboid family intramembrane serine protease [Anaerocolumna xylanovorans]|uniref:Membrane associated serine protease, rhomboid family n=1 Tax=Anaerocolumna xylanovorans DSM 12503 TaxID=1121345 RepID=A0A1M7XYX0_9FIRM|nr:rhomboid family intramembrane serine protease [Anaerocolumna xylanovorans]SHO44065.1 Membrane associated serine protease, rhomboid family [Anaerocolumna xylanovorans DSM 12503]
MKKLFGKFQYNSPVTLTFAFASLAVLLSGYVTGGLSTHLLFSVYRSSLADPLSYFRVFGHVLGHANWSHYSGNMVLFLVLGPILEEKYKSKDFLLMLAITALASGLFYVILYPGNVLLGASGIVFMMIVLSSAAGMKDGKIPLTLILVVIVYLGGEVLSIGAKDGVAHAAHIIGGICGAGFGLVRRRT